jgi:hypothetical protein
MGTSRRVSSVWPESDRLMRRDPHRSGVRVVQGVVIQMDNLSHTPGKNLHLAGVFSGQRRKTQVGGK